MPGKFVFKDSKTGWRAALAEGRGKGDDNSGDTRGL